jgi:uncharacterized protein YcbX
LSGARIAALHLYPLKGARGLALDGARAEVTGLAAAGIADRQWMAVDPAGRFITQRETPQLALIVPAQVDGTLVLRGRDGTALSLDPARTPAASRDVVVWRDAVRGHDEGDDAARWLTRQLGHEARLMRFDRSRTRSCNPDYVGDSSAHTLFADGYPLLVIGSASLAHLNERLARKGAAALPMNRFRPNVVIDGLAPHEEDRIEALSIGVATLRPVKPCTRCRVTTTDQETALVGREPLRTLAEYRYDAKLSGVTFGMNAIVTAAGTIGVGDEVVVRPAQTRGG